MLFLLAEKEGGDLLETEISRPTISFNSLNSSPQKNRDPQPHHAFLLSPWADSLMIGGLSIFVFVLYWLYVDLGASAYTVAEMAFWLSFVVNFPHFFSSYQLLYGDYRKRIFQKKSYLWAAVISPLLIVAALAYGIVARDTKWLALLAQGMFLSVGWHYVKQIFGTAIVTSAIQKRYFTTWERNFILFNLYSVWGMSWVAANLFRNQNESDGIQYLSLGLPEWLLTAAYISTAGSLLVCLGLGLHKYIKTGIRPATSSLVSFATIYVWYIPTLNHPVYFYLVPFFHSLQYLLFVTAFKKNQAREYAERSGDPPQQRLTFLRKFWGFLLLACVLGTLAFEVIPRGLDRFWTMDPTVFGPTLWIFAFNIFINLHHYFIDNVIWRGDNEDLKKYVVQASQRNYAEAAK